MIKATVQYINTKLEPLNYLEKLYGLCEIIVKGDKTFPAEYKGKGEYRQINDFDKYNGVSYIRKRGDITISEVDNTIESCSVLSEFRIPLRLVVIIPRKKLDCDDNYSEDVIAQTIMKAIINTDLKAALNARMASLQVDSYSTDSMGIMNEEYSGLSKKDINYKFAYLALDITAIVQVNQNCITPDCYGVYS